MQELSTTKATRGALSDAVARAKYAGERTVITVRGQPAAVLVPLADLAQLEQRPADVVQTSGLGPAHPLNTGPTEAER